MCSMKHLCPLKPNCFVLILSNNICTFLYIEDLKKLTSAFIGPKNKQSNFIFFILKCQSLYISSTPEDPDHIWLMSMKLSEVLSDLGLNDKSIQKRRTTVLLNECWMTPVKNLFDKDVCYCMFGSQSESSTLFGMDSDVDLLACNNAFNIIQDCCQWNPAKVNILPIQDVRTSPGYCLLQVLDDPSLRNIRSVEQNVGRKFDFEDDIVWSGTRILLKNTYLGRPGFGEFRNGPAASTFGHGKHHDTDIVKAFRCKSWPLEAKSWLEGQRSKNWPTTEMKKKCEATGFFVVPVASKCGPYGDLEWRISTSLAERLLMFSLNITQLRCYVLMKLVLKSFITPECGNAISSFICKTTLFFCIHKSKSSFWREQHLLSCLNYCLEELRHFVKNENCPHFVIHRNNLLAGKITDSDKIKLTKILNNIIQSAGRELFNISICQFGCRLREKFGIFPNAKYPTFLPVEYDFENEILLRLLAGILMATDTVLAECMHHDVDCKSYLTNVKSSLVHKYVDISSSTECKTAVRLLTPVICSFLGGVTASDNIYANNKISSTALVYLLGGCFSDVASGKLKLASILFCVGVLNQTDAVLNHISDLYRQNDVQEMCFCILFKKEDVKPEIIENSSLKNEEFIFNVLAFCVRFMPREINCMPKELQYELFKYFRKETLTGDFDFDILTNMAKVDSLPFLYFLQYKTYVGLYNISGKQKALINLINTTDTGPYLHHRETALNLLGQCMEQEQRFEEAFDCYLRSLDIRPKNNAARFHICKLISHTVQRRGEIKL